ncbi:MAG: hypothetical protein ACREDD_09415 [Methylocella sp.]
MQWIDLIHRIVADFREKQMERGIARARTPRLPLPSLLRIRYAIPVMMLHP